MRCQGVEEAERARTEDAPFHGDVAVGPMVRGGGGVHLWVGEGVDQGCERRTGHQKQWVAVPWREDQKGARERRGTKKGVSPPLPRLGWNGMGSARAEHIFGTKTHISRQLRVDGRSCRAVWRGWDRAFVQSPKEGLPCFFSPPLILQRIASTRKNGFATFSSYSMSFAVFMCSEPLGPHAASEQAT